MKLNKTTLIAFSLGLLATFVSCNDIDDVYIDTIPSTDTPWILAPGDMIPWNTKVQIKSSGVYQLPQGANSLFTRCFGKVTLSYENSNGVTQFNTCHSITGGSNQRNPVTGVLMVSYDLEEGSYAEVILE